MEKCSYCGSPQLSGQATCGRAECIKRAASLAADLDERTWRYKAIRQILPSEREARLEGERRTQQAAQLTKRAIARQIQHENLVRLYARLRREEGL